MELDDQALLALGLAVLSILWYFYPELQRLKRVCGGMAEPKKWCKSGR